MEHVVNSADERIKDVESYNEDMRLVERVKGNDVSAFNELVTKYRERLFAVIYNLTSNREDAFDLTQDVFIKALRSIDKFSEKSSFFTWIYRIAVNTALSHIRKTKFRRFFSFEKMQEDGIESSFSSCFEGKDISDKPTFLKELQENLNVALQKLSNTHRTVVVLYEIEGLSHTEIAEIMKCSAGTVRSRLHYAKEQLKSYLKDYIA